MYFKYNKLKCVAIVKVYSAGIYGTARLPNTTACIFGGTTKIVCRTIGHNSGTIDRIILFGQIKKIKQFARLNSSSLPSSKLYRVLAVLYLG